MRFSDIKGFEEEKKRLIHAIRNDHVAHAQMFLGKHGSPNLPLALAYATYVNCENPGEDDACGVCPSCIKNQKYIHPDMHFVFPVASTAKITGKDVVSTSFLAEWRAFLINNPFGDINDWLGTFGGENKQGNISKEESRQIIKNLSLKAFEGKYKIMIIWLPELMHSSSANAILKILEEPPEETLFLLVSNDSERLLTTILSRTQIFKVRNFNDQELAEILAEQHDLKGDQSLQLARLSGGDLNKAVKLLSHVEDNNYHLFREWMRFCFQRDFTNLVQRSEDFHKMTKISQRSFLEYGLNIIREALINPLNLEQLQRTVGEEIAFTENFGKVMSLEKVEYIYTKLNETHYHLERNASAKMAFLDLSLNIAKMIR
ncbi:MAG: DNA polymerase III subunit delta [Bacteroidota bacterium]